jgi:hypothetical protein
MNTSGILRLIIEDHLRGEPQALIGLAHWLIQDKHYTIDRLSRVLENSLRFTKCEIESLLVDLDLITYH